MAEKLYFIKLLQQALQQPEPQKALQKAFDKIAALGKQHGYEQGHKQFLHFMSLVQANLDGRQAQKEADQRIEPNAHQYLEHIKTLLNGYEPEHMLPGLIVERDGAPFATLMVDVGKNSQCDRRCPDRVTIPFDWIPEEGCGKAGCLAGISSGERLFRKSLWHWQRIQIKGRQRPAGRLVWVKEICFCESSLEERADDWRLVI